MRDVVRQELVSRQLAAHLPTAGRPLRVLDAGCGQGTQAIILARAGHEVLGTDSSEQMLAHARSLADAEPEAVAARLRFELGDVLDLQTVTAEHHDVVCCHGVAMYLPSLPELARALVGAAAHGGLISLLTRNQAGIAMRAGMTRRWSEAIAGFDATSYTNRIGVAGARADEPGAVRACFRDAGADPVAWYGVRLFSDHWDCDEQTDDVEGLVAAEQRAGERDPYRAVAALTHTLAIAP